MNQKSKKIELTKEQENLCYEYCKNNMRKLKRICNCIIKGNPVPLMYYDDLYSDALKVLLESVISYDDQKSSFQTFLIGNIKRSFYDWRRDKMRLIRCNLQVNKNGKIKKNEDGLPIIIHNISIDEMREDGRDLAEIISGDYDLEEEVLKSNYSQYSKELQHYLNRLSNLQVKVLTLLSEGYSQKEIISLLKINSSLFKDSIIAIRSYNNTKILEKLVSLN